MSSPSKVLSELPGLGSVALCDCGTVHVAVGAVTVRLAPEAFLQMMSMCRDAMENLSREMTYPTPQPMGSTLLH